MISKTTKWLLALATGLSVIVIIRSIVVISRTARNLERLDLPMQPAYVFGVLLFAIIIAAGPWIAFFIYKKKDRNRPVKEHKDRYNRILSNPGLSEEFKQKQMSLLQLRDLGGISQQEFEKKHNILEAEYIYKIGEIEKVYREQQESEKKKLLKENLDQALRNGILTQQEYNTKIATIYPKNQEINYSAPINVVNTIQAPVEEKLKSNTFTPQFDNNPVSSYDATSNNHNYDTAQHNGQIPTYQESGSQAKENINTPLSLSAKIIYGLIILALIVVVIMLNMYAMQ